MNLPDTLAYRLREPRVEDPAGALLLHHGRGADENDLFPLFDMLDPDGRLWGLSPRGPLTMPPGGAHWYVVRRVGYPDPSTFHPTFDLLTGWIDGALDALGLTHERAVIGGFSQGAVMSHAVSLARGRPQPAGLIALSGFVPTVDGLDLDLDDRSGFHVAIGHGAHDPVIEVGFGRDAKERLERAGADVLYRESPIPHTIDPDFIAELVPWLEKRLPA